MSTEQDNPGKFLRRIGVPEESFAALLEADERLSACGFGGEELCRQYLADPVKNSAGVFRQVDDAAERCAIAKETASFVFLCRCAPLLEQRYRQKRLPDRLFLDGMTDLRWKLLECRRVKGVWGTFVREWYAGFFAMTRFTLGRLQYEYDTFRGESYSACGYTVRKGDRVLAVHIPSSGPLEKKLREDSYRRAYSFFGKDFPNGPVVFTCFSWLLFPAHEQMLPPGCNIVSFLHDFDPVFSVETDTFSNGWRIYGAEAQNPPEKLPRDTAIRRAYAELLADGRKAGVGYGAFLFDGVSYLRKDGRFPPGLRAEKAESDQSLIWRNSI